MMLLEKEVETEHILGLTEGELQVLYQLHRPEYGVAVEVTTGEAGPLAFTAYAPLECQWKETEWLT